MEKTNEYGKIARRVENDEGVKYEVYNDHLGYPTFGIGHLILDSDPEHGSATGSPLVKIESKKPLKKTLWESCLTATTSTLILENCQKRLRE